VRRLVRWLMRRYCAQRIRELESCVQALSCDLRALEAECRMYRVRLGWEMPGRFSTSGHWVWHEVNGKQNPFPGVRWEHVLPASIRRVEDYCD
jgi:hypothetical protein